MQQIDALRIELTLPPTLSRNIDKHAFEDFIHNMISASSQCTEKQKRR